MSLDPDVLPCGWLQLARSGTIVRANRAAAALVGQPPSALVDLAFDSLLSKPSRLLYQSYLQPLLQLHGRTAELALYLQHADGSMVQVLVYSEPLPLPGPPGVSLLLAPVEQRKRIEDELLRVKAAADLAPGMVFQMLETDDGALRFPYVSAGVQQLYRVSESAATATAAMLRDRIHPEDQQRFDEERRQAAASGTTWRSTYRVMLGTDDSPRTHELSATARALPDSGRLWTGYVSDVSTRKALEQAKAERDAERRASRARSEFLARANHELRTPLNGILGFAQVLVSDPDADRLTARQQRALSVILDSGRHLLNLIKQLLDLSRMDSAAVDEPLRPVALAPLVQAACERSEPSAHSAAIELLNEVPPSLCALAEPLALGQVLDNLISNAIKYNRRGGRVRLAIDAGESGLLGLAVSDTGPGLSAQARARLFEPFNRLGAEHSHVAGAGLGLVITRQLVRLLGGELSVSSEPGRGSTFTVWLQRVPEMPAPDASGARPVAPEEGDPGASPLRALTLLYVEDNPVNAMVMEAILERRPHLRLRLADRAAQALEIAAREPIDLMMLDLHLPDGSGTELLGRLRALPGLSHTPAVLVTAAATEETRVSAAAAGFQACWSKPLDVDRTLAELDRLIEPLMHG